MALVFLMDKLNILSVGKQLNLYDLIRLIHV
jgi:hypothetical protein